MNPINNVWAQLPDRRFYTQLMQNFAITLAASLLYLGARHDGVGAGSLLLGAVVSAANFGLLSKSIPKLVRADLAAAPGSRNDSIVRRALGEFVVRYVIVGVVAYLATRSHSVHLVAFAMGLSLPIFAIMIQGLRMTFTGHRENPL